MGASEFFVVQAGKSPRDAFTRAVESARYEFGHGGYTGTIAEKRDFVMANKYPPEELNRTDRVAWTRDLFFRLLDQDTTLGKLLADKLSPAVCVVIEVVNRRDQDGLFAFFGLASS